MESTYNYRLIKASWGIAIDITAEALSLANSEYAAVEVRDGLWLSIDLAIDLSQQEHQMLAAGLSLVSQDMDDIVAKDGPLVIRVTNVWFNPADYQEEGLAYALAGWASQRFNLSLALPPVVFSKEANHYAFDLDPHAMKTKAQSA